MEFMKKLKQAVLLATAIGIVLYVLVNLAPFAAIGCFFFCR